MKENNTGGQGRGDLSEEVKCKTNFKRQDRQEAEGTAEAEAGQRPSGRKELGIQDTERGSTCAAGTALKIAQNGAGKIGRAHIRKAWPYIPLIFQFNWVFLPL